MKKRILAYLCILCMLLSVVGCGKEETQKATGNPTSAETETVTTEDAETEEPTETEDTSTSTWEFVEHTDGGEMRNDMTSLEFRDEMGIGWNLGNTMEAHNSDDTNQTGGSKTIGLNTPYSYELNWGAMVTTKAAIDGIRDAGFKTVRIPVYWGNMMADDGTFTISREYLDRVCQIINFCREDGLYVVVNNHHYDEFLIKNYSEEEVLPIISNLWTQIANGLKDYSDYVIFEGFNENVGTIREEDAANYTTEDIYDYVNALNQTFVDAVRATGGNNSTRMLIASGYWTNIDNTTSLLFQMPTDTAEDRLMVSVHYVDNVPYWSNIIGTQEWEDYSIAQCEELKQAFTDNGVVVFIGECTSIYADKTLAKADLFSTSSECMEWEIGLILDYGFIPVLWDTDENFYSRKNCVIKNQSDIDALNRLLTKVVQ